MVRHANMGLSIAAGSGNRKGLPTGKIEKAGSKKQGFETVMLGVFKRAVARSSPRPAWSVAGS
jgi:hypothetical protein